MASTRNCSQGHDSGRRGSNDGPFQDGAKVPMHVTRKKTARHFRVLRILSRAWPLSMPESNIRRPGHPVPRPSPRRGERRGGTSNGGKRRISSQSVWWRRPMEKSPMQSRRNWVRRGVWRPDRIRFAQTLMTARSLANRGCGVINISAEHIFPRSYRRVPPPTCKSSTGCQATDALEKS